MRKTAVIVAAVLLAATLLALILPRVISLDALKPRILALMEEKTGRKVVFSKISLSLFPGIGVKIADLRVSGDPGYPGETLLSVPESEVRLAIAPLLAGRAEFTKFILRRPEVLFRKYRDGTHSATQIANRLAREEGPVPPRGEKVSVALKSLSIEDAKLALLLEGEDGRETRWTIAPFTFRLSGIGGRRNDFEIETRIDGEVRGEIEIAGKSVREAGMVADPTFFDMDAKGKVFGQPVTVEGKMSAPMGLAEMDLTVAFPKIDLAKIPRLFARPPARLSEASLEGVATLVVKVSGNMQAMGFEAEADLTRAGWTAGPDLRKFIDMPCTVVAQGHRFPDLYLLSNAELQFPPLLVIANASLVPSTGVREWTASARIASLADFAKSRGGGLSKWAPAGRLTASGMGRRPTASARDVWNVALDLGDVGFQLPSPKLDLRSLNGHVELSSKTVDFQPLAGLLHGQRFTLRGSVSLGTAPAVGRASLRMPFLDLDALFPPAESGRPSQEPPPPAGKGEKPREISARGNIKVDAGKARGLEFQDLTGMGRYEDGTLFLDSLRARLYGGEATVSGRIRFAGPSPDFRVKVVVKDVAAGEILSRKTALKDFLSGRAFLSADLGGGARDFPDFARTAAGSGSFRVAGGKIKGVDLLAAAAGLSGLRSVLPLAAEGPGKAAETPFSDLSADFRIEGGKIRTDALRVLSEKMGLTGSAALGFDRTFDFQGALVLSGEMSERVRGAAGRFLTGPSGRVEIPLVMSGPVTSPAMAIDTEALAKGLAGKAIRGLMERVPGDSPSAGTEPGKAPDRAQPGKALEGLFEKLLPGRK